MVTRRWWILNHLRNKIDDPYHAHKCSKNILMLYLCRRICPCRGMCIGSPQPRSSKCRLWGRQDNFSSTTYIGVRDAMVNVQRSDENAAKYQKLWIDPTFHHNEKPNRICNHVQWDNTNQLTPTCRAWMRATDLFQIWPLVWIKQNFTGLSSKWWSSTFDGKVKEWWDSKETSWWMPHRYVSWKYFLTISVLLHNYFRLWNTSIGQSNGI